MAHLADMKEFKGTQKMTSQQWSEAGLKDWDGPKKGREKFHPELVLEQVNQNLAI